MQGNLPSPSRRASTQTSQLVSRNSRRSAFWVGVLGLAALAGCAAPARSLEGGGATARVVDSADAERVLGAAQGLLSREFGRVTVDRGGLRLTTDPVEYQSAADTGTARGAVGLPSRLRRSAILVLRPQAERLLARLRIDVEREDAQRRGTLRPEGDNRFGDSPAYTTPIDEDAATDTRQNVSWTRVRRDTALERTLLEELQSQFATEPASSAPARP